jgi:SAM-dependent methyltransferase
MLGKIAPCREASRRDFVLSQMERSVTSPAHEIAAPSRWVERWAALIRRGGTVLDVACGHGRHARFLAARGLNIVAADRDLAVLASLSGVAGVTPHIADLEDEAWPFIGQSFDGVVVTNYLYRPLFGQLSAALAPGGVLIYETFMAGNERLGKPANPNFLLRPGELLAAFAALTVVAFEQGLVEQPKPAVVQRICALRGTAETARID